MLRVVGTLNSPLQLSDVGDLESMSFDSGSSPGEDLRAAREPVGDRCGYRGEIARFLPPTKGVITLNACAAPAHELEEESRIL